jgi:hypothetical protein
MKYKDIELFTPTASKLVISHTAMSGKNLFQGFVKINIFSLLSYADRVLFLFKKKKRERERA